MHDYLLWEEQEPKLSILVRRGVLDELKEVAEQAFRATGAEAGGVLVGRSEDIIETGQRVITIENIESDMSRLHAGSVVGFVRLRKQRMLHLIENDFLTLRSGLGLVCLMVRPDSNAGAVGGFFVREGKTVHCPSLDMQFPIDGRANDCHRSGRVVVREAAGDDEPRGSLLRKLLYGAVGLALMLASLAIWLIGR